MRPMILIAMLPAALFASDCPDKAFRPGAGDWNGWSTEVTNSRFQAQPKLVPADVPKLKVKWAFGFPGAMRAVGQVSVVGGRVFVGAYDKQLSSRHSATR